MLNHPTTHAKSTWENLDQTKRVPLHMGKKKKNTTVTAEAQSAKPFLMSFFPSPYIRTELGQHSATVGREAARMGAHGRRKKKRKVFIKDSEVEVGGEEEGGEKREEERLKWSRNASLLLSLPSNQGDKVMPVRAFVIPANPSSRYFIRFGIWLSALIRYSTGRRVNNWRAADNEKLSAPLYPLTITLPLSALAPLRLKHCVVFTCKGFHLLMIRPVFSASGDNVLSALWEISMHFFFFFFSQAW